MIIIIIIIIIIYVNMFMIKGFSRLWIVYSLSWSDQSRKTSPERLKKGRQHCHTPVTRHHSYEQDRTHQTDQSHLTSPRHEQLPSP